MIFEGISKVSKALQKNVAKPTFFFTLFWFGWISVTIQAGMAVSTQSIPIQSVFFLDSSFIGITSKNSITKALPSGRTQWQLTPKTTKIVGFQTAFNRFAFINSRGEIDSYDAQFGIHYWTSTVKNLRQFKLAYPTIYALSTDQKWVYLIDFYTGYTIGQRPFPSGVGPVTEIALNDSGDCVFVAADQRLSLSPTGQWTVQKTNKRPLAFSPDSLAWSGDLLLSPTGTPQFAMGRQNRRIRYEGSIITLRDANQSRIPTWILDTQLIIEIAPNFNMIRIYENPSLALILEWKSPDPDDVWTDVWYDNQLIAIRNQSNQLSLWNGKSREFIGTTLYPFLKRDVIGMNAVSDVISLVSHSQTAFAILRK